MTNAIDIDTVRAHQALDALKAELLQCCARCTEPGSVAIALAALSGAMTDIAEGAVLVGPTSAGTTVRSYLKSLLEATLRDYDCGQGLQS